MHMLCVELALLLLICTCLCRAMSAVVFLDNQSTSHEMGILGQVSAQLRTLPGVRVIPRDGDLKYKHDNSRIWNETWLSAFFNKPCNHELFVRQSLNMEGM